METVGGVSRRKQKENLIRNLKIKLVRLCKVTNKRHNKSSDEKKKKK